MPRFRLPFFHQRPTEVDELANAIDDLILGEPIWETKNSQLKDLIHLARLRQAMGRSLRALAISHQERTWALLLSRLSAQTKAGPRLELRVPFSLQNDWPKLAMVTAVLDVVILAVGLLAFTGLVDHPVTRFVTFVSQLVIVI